jgi:hypothetical protein
MTTAKKPTAKKAPPAKVNWFALETKIKYAAGVMLALDGATIIAALNGSTTWKDALIGIVSIDLPVIVGYFKSSSP